MRSLLALFVLVLATACSSPCEELAEKLCACEPGAEARRTCAERKVQDAERRSALTDADQDRCESFVETCDCNQLGTAEGKRACGEAP